VQPPPKNHGRQRYAAASTGIAIVFEIGADRFALVASLSVTLSRAGQVHGSPLRGRGWRPQSWINLLKSECLPADGMMAAQ
jgi:hypothetical protein